MRNSELTTLGLAHNRYGNFPFGIGVQDRLMHMYTIGQTGTGKSTLLLNMALQDAAAGHGIALIDPHGDLSCQLAKGTAPKAIYWDVADHDCPYGYNPLSKTSPEYRPLVASGLIEALKKQWPEAWGVRMEHLLRFATLALLDAPKTDLRDILRIFLDDDFRKTVISHISNEQVRDFWMKEYPNMNYKKSVDGLAPIANKLGAFLAHPIVRKAVCEPKKPLRFRRIMDEGEILIVNLSKGRLGADIANVLGGLLVSGIMHAAFTRNDQPEAERQPFFLYVDEFHSFTTDSVADLLSETRKYKLGVILSQQHTGQSGAAVFASIFGNVGTMICFRVGAADTSIISTQLGGIESRFLINQPNYRAFVRMLIGGEPAKVFTMTTMPTPILSEQE